MKAVGLGLVAGAVLLHPLHAQVRDTMRVRARDTISIRPKDSVTIVVPARGDSISRDSLAKGDTVKKKPVKRDSIQAPTIHSEQPGEIDIGRRLHWSRDSILATGALTVADLLDKVQGLSTIRAGWISSPAVAAYMGDVRHVRVFLDGIELEALDPRAYGQLDLTQINLWSAEDATVEQGPEEVRVYLRTMRVVNTTPFTRTDVSTGDQQSNLYRGYFGERFENGVALQFGAQQYGTTPPSSLGSSSDQLGLMARVGWAKKNWSFDANMNRISRHRGEIFGLELGDSIRSVESSRNTSYLRGGYGDPDSSPYWAQATAVSSSYGYTGVRTVPTTGLTTAADSALAVASLDTSKYQTQYIAAGGLVRGPLRASLTQRVFIAGGKYIESAAWRGSFTTDRLSVSAFSQGKSADSLEQSDVTARLSPLSWIALFGSAGRSSDRTIRDSSFSANYVRAQAGLRIHNLWLIGGVLRRDSVRLTAPTIFDSSFTARHEPAVTAVTASVRGQLYRLLNVDLSAVKWNDTTGFYRPRYQTRSELFLQSNFLKRFPSNDFGLKASIVHEYRSAMRFPVGTADVNPGIGYRTISSLLEIRILSATISWQFRNVLGERYFQVPSFVLPRQTNFYGVRWEFTN
ncbi:MAG: hypothetical protein ABI442_00420 [Gemmatimonadaceae bacterium]